MSDLFPGFDGRYVATDEGRLFVRVGGEGEPLVLLHGFPQSHAMWHAMAGDLAKRFRVIVPDLRGYGWSSVVRSGPDHAAYSKRAMGEDLLRLVEDLGHTRFHLAGHDRGGRVAYRLALDHPGRVSRLALLDILPTLVMWERIEAAPSDKTAHWPWLAGPAPHPENAILADPNAWFEAKLAGWSKKGTLAPFHPLALRAYRDAWNVPERIHAFCEDYRAGATLDRAHDLATRQAGARIACPTLVLWGDAGIPAGAGTPLDSWRAFASDLSGAAIDAGHFLPEENPAATLAAWQAVLA